MNHSAARWRDYFGEPNTTRAPGGTPDTGVAACYQERAHLQRNGPASSPRPPQGSTLSHTRRRAPQACAALFGAICAWRRLPSQHRAAFSSRRCWFWCCVDHTHKSRTLFLVHSVLPQQRWHSIDPCSWSPSLGTARALAQLSRAFPVYLRILDSSYHAYLKCQLQRLRGMHADYGCTGHLCPPCPHCFTLFFTYLIYTNSPITQRTPRLTPNTGIV